MENLAELKKSVTEYCERRMQNGGAVTNYECPSCQAMLVSATPDNEGEKWDSVTVCFECGEHHFAIKTKGNIKATQI